jgi:hypothetical protein
MGGIKMKRSFRSKLNAVVLAIFAFAAVASAQGFRNTSGITIYEDINYGGRSQNFRNDVPNLVPLGWNDLMSSFTIGRGEQWEICEDINYGGRCRVVTGNETDMRNGDWNDIVSSFRRVRGNRPPTGYPGGDYIVLYNQTNYRGNQTTYSAADSSINDNARSVTVGRGTWQLCDGVNFTGRCVTVSQNITNLGSYNIGRIIRSIRPTGFGQPGPGPFPGADNYLTLYDQANYRGTATNYNVVQNNISDNARSVTVGRGTWVVCDGANFTGRCITLTQNVPDQRSYNIGRTIRSVRPGGIVPPNFPGRPNANWYLVLFDQPDFRGASETYRGAMPNINKRTRSATVSGGVWEVCDGPNYTGRCQTLTVNVPNFRIYSIGDQVRSVRPQYQQ